MHHVHRAMGIEGEYRAVLGKGGKQKVHFNRIGYQTIALAAAVTALSTPVAAYEAGAQATQVQPGVILGGSSAAAPPPGLYMIDQAFTYQAHIVGPGAPSGPIVNGGATSFNVNVVTGVLLYVPGWTFLGATYDAVFVQPYGNGSVNAPANVDKVGFHNSYVVPGELSWKLGDSGFYVKAGLGISIPDGTITTPTGLGNIGSPWWTFVPQVSFSYLKDGWNLSTIVLYETNTANTDTGYRSGDTLDAEFIATKTIGKWTFGPVGYYYGQVTDDTSSAYYGNAINVNRFNVWAAGGLVGYNFGPAQLNVWATDEFGVSASGGSPIPAMHITDRADITSGFKLFASLSYRLWAPDEPAETPKRPQFFK
jgi:hypothetical protein